MNLFELRSALRLATGPDVNLDLELFRHFNPNRNPYTWLHGRPCLFLGFNKEWRAIEPDPYTAKLDVALMLLPDDCWYSITGPDQAEARFYRRNGDIAVNVVTATTTPIAICLARVEYEIAKEANNATA